ncbi:hypothetical protein SRABI106_03149 [Rahnella aquatilis]|nr:hypothetical protein SRABI106_03149 [Rahnella aquatilis]
MFAGLPSATLMMLSPVTGSMVMANVGGVRLTVMACGASRFAVLPARSLTEAVMVSALFSVASSAGVSVTLHEPSPSTVA